ncbi:MAG: hypothetical protein ACJAYU_002509 [Bradymonadia bacterium]|jgi:uncharacterized protein YaeQ
MALPSTLHRFELGLSDVDRGVYEQLEFRIAKHPSESADFALVRLLAYALEYEEGLEFGPGLYEATEPALSKRDMHGTIEKWVDIGAPSADRLHKASKKAGSVVVYSHREMNHLEQDWSGKKIHQKEDIRVVLIPRKLIRAVTPSLGRTNRWDLLRTEGILYITAGGETHEGTVEEHRIS